jgi:tetratricopeptide (TPR) repeat protein
LEIDRNLVGAHAYLGALKARLGRAEETEAHVNEAVRLSPLDALFYIWATIAGAAKLVLGRDAEAVIWLRRAVDANANFPTSHFLLAAALAQLDRISEAQSELRLGLAVYPSFTIAKYRAGLTSDNPIYLAGVELIVDGLRRAGLPEQ